jgi:hypothetical protein
MQSVAKLAAILKWDEALHPRDAEGQFVPKEPGTTPVPPGKIRGFHYTDSMDAVEKEGLSVAKAKGAGYGEPNAIWFSTAQPGEHKDYVEVFLDPSELVYGPVRSQDNLTPEEAQARITEFNLSGHDFMTFTKEVPPERFVTTHRKWHDHFRYMESHPDLKAQVLAGEFDWLAEQDPVEHGPAIAAIKAGAKSRV